MKQKMTLDEFKLQYSLGTLSAEQKVNLAKAKTGVHPGIFEILANEKDTEPKDSSTYSWFSRGSNSLAEVVARNPSCPVELLRKLSMHVKDSVKIFVGANPSCPPDILLSLLLNYDTDNDVRRAVLRNPNCPSNVLITIATQGKFDYHVAGNPNIPAQAAEAIYRRRIKLPGATRDIVFRELAGNLNIPTEMLIELCKKPFEVRIRKVACSNIRCPLEALIKATKDKSSGVRQIAAAKILAMVNIDRIHEIMK